MSRIRTRDGYRTYSAVVYAAGAVMTAAAILTGVNLGRSGHVAAAAIAMILAAGIVAALVRWEAWPRLCASRDGTFELRREILDLAASQGACAVRVDRAARVMVGVETRKRRLARQWTFLLIDEDQVLEAGRPGTATPVTAICYRIASDRPDVLRREAAAVLTVTGGGTFEVENIMPRETFRETRERKRAGLLYATADELQVLIRHLKAASALDGGEE